MQGYNVQEADRMSVAIHPSETRRIESGAASRSRLPLIIGLAGGSVALAVFAAGAFSFFSGLADPRVKPVRATPVASQWPDLKDGVPALAAAEPAQAPLSASVPSPASSTPAGLTPASPIPTAPVPVKAAASEPDKGQDKGQTQARLQIEPAQTVPPATRPTTTVEPSKVAIPLPPSRTETVRAKAEQPARFVSLPAPKAKEEPKSPAIKAATVDGKAGMAKSEKAKGEKARGEKAKGEAAKPAVAKLDTARDHSAPSPSQAADVKPTQTAAAEAPAAQDNSDEPELLGVKIPGGRQIRDGWDAAVNGLVGGK